MVSASISGVASSIIGGPYSYIRVLHRSFLLKAIVFYGRSGYAIVCYGKLVNQNVRKKYNSWYILTV